MAQTVADVELIDRVITDSPKTVAVPTLKSIRLGVAQYFLNNMDQETTQFFADLLPQL